MQKRDTVGWAKKKVAELPPVGRAICGAPRLESGKQSAPPKTALDRRFKSIQGQSRFGGWVRLERWAPPVPRDRGQEAWIQPTEAESRLGRVAASRFDS